MTTDTSTMAIKSKPLPSQLAHRAALISDSVALSQALRHQLKLQDHGHP